jgi:hypothetical protein
MRLTLIIVVGLGLLAAALVFLWLGLFPPQPTPVAVDKTIPVEKLLPAH